MKRLFTAIIHFYQLFSRYIFPNPVCRFEPSCSNYAMLAIKKYGSLKGSFLAARRLIRCNPLCKGGYDPVK